MDKTDFPRFLQALNAMAELFCDEMSAERQRAYWETLKDTMTIDEWVSLSRLLMQTETFYKVPLPAICLAALPRLRPRTCKVVL